MTATLPTFTGRRLDANEREHALWLFLGGGHESTIDGAAVERREPCQMCELISRHGFVPGDIAWVEYDVIDCPLLRFGIYLERDGQRYLDENGHAAMRVEEALLVGNLPAWWQPAA